MTATLHRDVAGRSDSDAELARAAADGDKRAFADIYGRYADRLHDFCVGMLADRDGAADCVQDAFCIAATRLPQLRDPGKLRPWLYSIARNEALRRLRDRRRETPSDDLPDAASDDPGPDLLAARLELAGLIADAAGGLSDRDRAVLELAFRHGLSGPDLSDALGVTPANANTIVHRLRDTIERSLGALLVSRRVRTGGGCVELSAILDGWDGDFNVLMRKRISRHIESCDACDEERRRLVSPTALLGAAPVFIPAPAWLRDRTLSRVELTSWSTSMSDGPVRADRLGAARGMLLPVIAFAAALIAALGATVLWVSLQNTTIEAPIEVGVVVPAAPVSSVAPPVPATVAPPTRSTPVPLTPRATPAAPTSPPPEPSEPPPPPSPPAVPLPAPPLAEPSPPPTLPPLPPLSPLPPLLLPPWPDGDPGGPAPVPRPQFTGPSGIAGPSPPIPQ